MVLFLLMQTVARADALVWTQFENQTLGRIDGDGTARSTIPIGTADQPFAPLGVGANSSYIFITNPGLRLVGRTDLDGSNLQIIVSGGTLNPRGIAANDSYVFWADVDASQIFRTSLDGGGMIHFSALASGPQGIAVDGYSLYWSTQGGIYKSAFDGSGGHQIAALSDAQGDVRDIAVFGSSIYWTSFANGKIFKKRLRRLGHHGSNFRNQFALGDCRF